MCQLPTRYQPCLFYTLTAIENWQTSEFFPERNKDNFVSSFSVIRTKDKLYIDYGDSTPSMLMVESSNYRLALFGHNPKKFLLQSISSNETWFHHNTAENRQQWKQWIYPIYPGESAPKESKGGLLPWKVSNNQWRILLLGQILQRFDAKRIYSSRVHVCVVYGEIS